MELFPSMGMKISLKIPMGMENLLFPAQKMPVGMVLECNFFISISNRDKILGQFSSGVEILGFLPQRGRFFDQFFQWGGDPTGL